MAGDRSPTKIINEMEQKLSVAQRENYQLRQEYEEKQAFYEKVSYKNAKAQSQFIEVMRELSRFRDEFNDVYSLRSKLLKTSVITQKIDNLIASKNKALTSEVQLLGHFKEQANHLFKQKARSRHAENTGIKNKEYLQIGETLKKMC